MTRIVSVTPLAVRRDSRTYKQAASMTRMGYESIVFEGRPSHLEHDGLPFELASAPVEFFGEPESSAVAEAAPPDIASQSLWKRLRARLHPLAFIAWTLVVCGVKTARRLPSADLYYLHSFSQFPAIWLRKRARGTPYVYDAHDFYPESRSEVDDSGAGAWIVERFMLALERLCVRGASDVVTVGNGVADLIEQEFKRRPVIVRNCHDGRIDRDRGRRLKESLDLDADAFLIVTAGNAKLGSATDQALSALAGLPDRVHFAFVGAGYERTEATLRSLGLEARVHIVPPVEPTEIVPFVSDADLAAVLYHALTPDYLHSLPNRFFSAIAAGLPLLYPRQLPELSKLAERHGLGVAIDPRSPASIATGVQGLIDDSARLEALRANVHRAREELTWEREEQKLSDLITSALAAR